MGGGGGGAGLEGGGITRILLAAKFPQESADWLTGHTKLPRVLSGSVVEWAGDKFSAHRCCSCSVASGS